MTLRALQSAAKRQGTSAPMTWRALNATNAGMGVPDIDYDRFSARWDDPEEGKLLKQFVDRFDGNGLVIKTGQGNELPQGSHREVEMSRMAKRATHKNRKFD